MPVLNIHLVRGQHPASAVENLLLRCSQAFADGLNCPIERVRVFITEHEPRFMCIGGKPVSESGVVAPYFSFVVLQGRPLEDRQKLLAAFTDLIVEVLGVQRDLVRGGVVPVAPEDWSIGGQPASLMRQSEIDARRQAGERK